MYTMYFTYFLLIVFHFPRMIRVIGVIDLPLIYFPTNFGRLKDLWILPREPTRVGTGAHTVWRQAYTNVKKIQRKKEKKRKRKNTEKERKSKRRFGTHYFTSKYILLNLYPKELIIEVKMSPTYILLNTSSLA